MFFYILEQVRRLGNKATDQHYTVSGFSALIRSQFPTADFVVRTHRSDQVDVNQIIPSGYYDADADRHSQPHVEIVLSYNSKQDSIMIGNVDWDQFGFALAECVGHELVHRRQARDNPKTSFSPKDSTEYSYYSLPSELEAYGFSLAAESVVYDRDFDQCSIYQQYRQIFDANDLIVLKLLEQFVKYRRQLEVIYEQNNSAGRVRH